MAALFQQKIDELRQRPKAERLKFAIRFTLISGVVVVILWLVIFLPFQLRSNDSDNSSLPEQKIKEFLVGSATPIPTTTLAPVQEDLVTPEPTSRPEPSPAPVQLLPSSEDEASPSPTITPTP